MDTTATGITRRLDDLGRIVIPKEVRETMSLREGDPLEIFVDLESDTVAYDMADCLNDNLLVEEYLTRCICDYLNDKCGYNNCDGNVKIWI